MTEPLSNHEVNTIRADCSRRYEEFWEVVDPMIAVAYTGNERNEYPGYLGAGTASCAFAFEHEGAALVAKIIMAPSIAMTVENRTVALARGHGVAGAEQMRAYSLSDGVIVSEKARGRPLRYMEDPGLITQEVIIGLYTTCKQLAVRSLGNYRSTDNILCDPGHGFTVTDYRYPPRPEKIFPPERTLACIAGWPTLLITEACRQKSQDAEYEPDLKRLAGLLRFQELVAGLEFITAEDQTYLQHDLQQNRLDIGRLRDQAS